MMVEGEDPILGGGPGPGPDQDLDLGQVWTSGCEDGLHGCDEVVAAGMSPW